MLKAKINGKEKEKKVEDLKKEREETLEDLLKMLKDILK